MKQTEIIIDGVDVSECTNFNKENGFCRTGFKPEQEPTCDQFDCYYKQLKRKEAECELLEKINKENQEKIKQLNEKLEEESIARQYGDEALFMECEDYKQALEKIEEIVKEKIQYNKENSIYSSSYEYILQIIKECKE